MVSLTSQQRNILHCLLQVETTVTMSELSDMTNLTPRQVDYRLRNVRLWLEVRGVKLSSKSGVGYELQCSHSQRQSLLAELNSGVNFELVLQSGERQQLLALILLTSSEPKILKQLQQHLETSRVTTLKDIDAVEAWLARFEVNLERRPNYGFSVAGTELALRQAIMSLFWGDIPFGESLYKISYDKGLLFSLSDARSFSTVVKDIEEYLHYIDVLRSFEWVALAEAQMRGRFADNAALHLALMFAVQFERIKAGKLQFESDRNVLWLKAQPIWLIASHIASDICEANQDVYSDSEIAVIAMHLVAGIRSEEWPGEAIEIPEYTNLIDILVDNVMQAYFEPELAHDLALREGLVAHVIPALARQRFHLWAPPSWSDGTIAQSCPREYRIAQGLAELIEEHTGVDLPSSEIDTITTLIRAAYLRARPVRRWNVFVICPSGMATAQLLAARLKTRFPNLDVMGVLSQRELSTKRVNEAHILITTTPIEMHIAGVRIIEVHPLLLPKDIAAISDLISS